MQASSSGSGPSHTPSPSKRRVGGTTHKAKTVAPASSSGPNEHEQTIIDLLSRSQPFADHSYTTVFGKRYNQPPPGQESDEVVDDKNSNVQSNMTVAVRVNSSTMGKMNHVHVPVIRLGQLPHGQPTTEGETMLITESEIDSYGTKNNMTSRSEWCMTDLADYYDIFETSVVNAMFWLLEDFTIDCYEWLENKITSLLYYTLCVFGCAML